MAKKNNLRYMRFSDEIIEMIESQQGENFSQKFENLVTRCMWELPKKEQELQRLNEEIDAKCRQLQLLGGKYINLSRLFSDISGFADDIGNRLCSTKRNL